MNRSRLIGLIGLALLICVISCRGSSPVQPLGNTASGLKPAPGYAISPERAVELATPFLDDSFELRSRYMESVNRNDARPPMDWVTLKGNVYYVARENYPSITAEFYLPYAVRVHATTGDVTPPARPKKL